MADRKIYRKDLNKGLRVGVIYENYSLKMYQRCVINEIIDAFFRLKGGMYDTELWWQKSSGLFFTGWAEVLCPCDKQ